MSDIISKSVERRIEVQGGDPLDVANERIRKLEHGLALAERCPACNGTGADTDSDGSMMMCAWCEGKGEILRRDIVAMFNDTLNRIAALERELAEAKAQNDRLNWDVHLLKAKRDYDDGPGVEISKLIDAELSAPAQIKNQPDKP